MSKPDKVDPLSDEALNIKRKRRINEEDLEASSDPLQKRTKEMLQEQVSKAHENVEVGLSKMTPQERKL
jgi:hypothetical protein